VIGAASAPPPSIIGYDRRHFGLPQVRPPELWEHILDLAGTPE
jgi:hypothetical protein